MELLQPPRVEHRPVRHYLGIRVRAPFRGMLAVRDQLLAELYAWRDSHPGPAYGTSFLRLHVIDMAGTMDIAVGVCVEEPAAGDDRVRPGLLPAGDYATLTYRTHDRRANKLLLEWVSDQGLALDRRSEPDGDHFGCRYEEYLTEPRSNPRKTQWEIALSYRLDSVPPLVGDPVVDWLLDSDPALRWQVERDLVGAPEEVWSATRARVATDGFGARLLALQDDDGQWAGGAYFPKTVPGSEPGPAEGEGQPWTATTWTLNTLREWGVDAAALAGTGERLALNSRWEYNDLPYWGGEVDCCINGYTIANGAWLGVDVSELAAWFPDHQRSDGGWNCEWVEGSTHSSFHSTLNSLRGLLAYEAATGGSDALRTARKAGEGYLLERRLLYRRSTGELVGPWATELVYPHRWVYNVLNALDYFRSAALMDGIGPDPRLADAIDVVRAARQSDGRWLQQGRHGGRAWFEIDAPPGEPSRWLTFLGTRVLSWWDASTQR